MKSQIKKVGPEFAFRSINAPSGPQEGCSSDVGHSNEKMAHCMDIYTEPEKNRTIICTDCFSI